MENYWDETERQRVYPGFILIKEKDTKNLLNNFRGLKEAIDRQNKLRDKENREVITKDLSRSTEDKDKERQQIQALIECQNVNLRLNLNPQAIIPIAIPDKFIRTIEGEDSMEVIADLIDSVEGFLG